MVMVNAVHTSAVLAAGRDAAARLKEFESEWGCWHGGLYSCRDMSGTVDLAALSLGGVSRNHQTLEAHERLIYDDLIAHVWSSMSERAKVDRAWKLELNRSWTAARLLRQFSKPGSGEFPYESPWPRGEGGGWSRPAWQDAIGDMPAPAEYVSLLARELSRHLFGHEGISFDPAKNVELFSGSSMIALRHVLEAVGRPGGIALVPQGSFDLHGDVVAQAGMTPFFALTADCGLKLTPQRFREIVEQSGQQIDVVFLTDSINPTGEGYTRLEIEALLVECKQQGACLVNDKLYSHYRLPGAADSSLPGVHVGTDIYKRMVVVTGTSKISGNNDIKGTVVATLDEEVLEKLRGPSTSKDREFCSRLVAQIRTALAYSVADYKPRVDRLSGIVSHFDNLLALGNQNISRHWLRFYRRPTQGFFALLLFDEEMLSSVGISNSTTLSRYLLERTGVITRDVSGMLLAKIDGAIPLRINYSGGLDMLNDAFKRFNQFGLDIVGGRALRAEKVLSPKRRSRTY